MFNQIKDDSRPGRREDNLKTLTGATFGAVLRGGGPVVVEFMSYGCAHCRLLEPVLQRVAQQVGAQETICRVNVAVEQELAVSYHIAGTPTLIMFLGGREVARSEGPSPTLSNILATVQDPFQ